MYCNGLVMQLLVGSSAFTCLHGMREIRTPAQGATTLIAAIDALSSWKRLLVQSGRVLMCPEKDLQYCCTGLPVWF